MTDAEVGTDATKRHGLQAIRVEDGERRSDHLLDVQECPTPGRPR